MRSKLNTPGRDSSLKMVSFRQRDCFSTHLLLSLDYCSPLGTYFSSLLTFWISDKLTTGPGNFFIPGICFFSSEVAGAPWGKKGGRYSTHPKPRRFDLSGFCIEQENKYQRNNVRVQFWRGNFLWC